MYFLFMIYVLPITAKRAPPRGDPGSGRERQRDGQNKRETEREKERW